MKSLENLFLLLTVLEVCFASILPSSATTINPEGDAPNDQEPCETDLTNNFKYLAESCPRIAPRRNYTESMNLLVLSADNLLLFQKLNMVNINNDTELVDICDVMGQSNYTSGVHVDDILARDQLCEIVRDSMNENKLRKGNINDISEFRRGCGILSSVQKIATVDATTAPELTADQLEAFHEVGGQKCSFDRCRRLAIAVEKCRFLNETVSSEDQADKLGITVKLYEKLVNVRKLYTDRAPAGRLAQAKRSCEAINGIEGDGINLALGEHILKLSTDSFQKFTDLWDRYRTAPNAEKIATIKDICAFLDGVIFE